MLCCLVLFLLRLCCAGPELPRLLLAVAVGRVARDADVLLLWPGHVVRFQEIELIIEMHINISDFSSYAIYSKLFFSVATFFARPKLGHQGNFAVKNRPPLKVF